MGKATRCACAPCLVRSVRFAWSLPEPVPGQVQAQERYGPAVGILRIDGPLDAQLVDEVQPEPCEGKAGEEKFVRLWVQNAKTLKSEMLKTETAKATVGSIPNTLKCEKLKRQIQQLQISAFEFSRHCGENRDQFAAFPDQIRRAGSIYPTVLHQQLQPELRLVRFLRSAFDF